MTDTPKSVTGIKKKTMRKKNYKDVSALRLTPRVLRLIFSSTGITDLTNYSLRKYPLYDLIRRSIRNFPGSLQCILEDHFIHRDHIRISCTDVYFSPCVWLALRALLALTFDKNISLVLDKKISSASIFIRDWRKFKKGTGIHTNLDCTQAE